MRRQLAQDVALAAIVENHGAPPWFAFCSITLVPRPRHLTPGIHLTAAHVLGEIEPNESGEIARLAPQRVHIELTAAVMRHHAMRHALLANAIGERTRIDSGDPRNVV